MNEVLISLGSNHDPETNLEDARRMLKEHLGELRFTPTLQTEPYGKHYKSFFTNQLVVASTEMTLEAVTTITKQIEQALGRQPEDKARGIVKIDIDVFGWNGHIIRPRDYDRPYVKDLLPQLKKILHR